LLVYSLLTHEIGTEEAEPFTNSASLRAFRIVGAAMDVHKELGCGFSEVVYQEALEIEFKIQEIPYNREQKLELSYKGQKLSKFFKADFICYDKIVVELKALSQFDNQNVAQTINYLKATGFKLGLLLNWGEMSLKYKRLVY
jgi:GxxExxY protein